MKKLILVVAIFGGMLFTAEATNTKNYKIVFVFSVENNQSMRYEWNVNLESGEISSTDGPSRIILQTVDHYD